MTFLYIILTSYLFILIKSIFEKQKQDSVGFPQRTKMGLLGSLKLMGPF